MPRTGRAAALLREARIGAALSQRALARRARTTQSVVARIELGLASPTQDTLRRLLGAAGYELRAVLEPRPVLDPGALDDVPRILRLSPEDRLREVGSLDRFLAAARPAPGEDLTDRGPTQASRRPTGDRHGLRRRG
jgi:transcriptional regulator with XRE-family HTH domain